MASHPGDRPDTQSLQEGQWIYEPWEATESTFKKTVRMQLQCRSTNDHKLLYFWPLGAPCMGSTVNF